MHRTIICNAMRLFMFTELAPPLASGGTAISVARFIAPSVAT